MKLRYLLIMVIAVGLCSQPSLAEARGKGHPRQVQSKKHVVAGKKKSEPEKTLAIGKRHHAKVAAEQTAPKTCKTRHGRRHKAVRSCVVAEPELKSPIKEVDLGKPVPDSKDSEVKARMVPDRAYAVDGDTFFYQGRKFRVSGLGGGDVSEMAKQRLQKALDTGGIAVEPLSVDEAGVTTAIVKINSKNLVDQMAKP